MSTSFEQPGDSHKGWDTYPLQSEIKHLPDKDRSFYYQRLHQDSSRLFSPNEISIERISWYSNRSGQTGFARTIPSIDPVALPWQATESHCGGIHCQLGVERRSIQSIEELLAQIQGNVDQGEHMLLFVPRISSWSPLCITQEACQRMLYHQRVFTSFLNVIHSFGFRTNDDLPGYHATHSFISTGLEVERTRHLYELCYTIQYVEENGRKGGYPWSTRQTGVYQQVDSQTRKSVWIIIQPSKYTQECLEQTLQDREQRLYGPESNPMLLHTVILLTTSENWEGYIEYLYSRFLEIDERGCFSRPENRSSNAHSVTISDIQKLQRLRKRFARTFVVLNSCLGVAAELEHHCRKLSSLDNIGPRNEIMVALRKYKTSIEHSRQNIRMIMQTLSGSADLLSSILSFRNSETLRDVNETTCRSIELLRDTTTYIQRDNAAMAVAARQSQRDSTAIKALTTVATILIPASVMAEIFNSNLIQLTQGKEREGQGTHFQLASQFWIYVLTTIGLTFLVLASTRWLENRSMKALNA